MSHIESEAALQSAKKHVIGIELQRPQKILQFIDIAMREKRQQSLYVCRQQYFTCSNKRLCFKFKTNNK